MFLVSLLALPFAGAIAAALLRTNARNAAAWLAGPVALGGLAIALSRYPGMADGEVERFAVEWLPALGIDFSLRMDGLAWLFCLLVTGIGFLVVLYARY